VNIDHIFFTSALAGGEWSTSRPGRFTPGEKAPGTHSLDRKLGGSQSRLGRCGDEKTPDPTGTRTLALSVIHPVASRYMEHAIPSPF
jgi:hypothetical protein